MKNEDSSSPFEAFYSILIFPVLLLIQELFLKRKDCERERETERALQFPIILEGAVIIYGQLSDSDIQLTTTCLWPVIRACPSDGPFAYLSVL